MWLRAVLLTQRLGHVGMTPLEQHRGGDDAVARSQSQGHVQSLHDAAEDRVPLGIDSLIMRIQMGCRQVRQEELRTTRVLAGMGHTQ